MRVVSLALDHLRISLLALALGIAIAVPLALFVAHRPRGQRIALAIASVVQTIPGLALLAAMVPALVWLGATLHTHIPSIGELPAVLALSVYAVLPIVRGVVLGIAGIDPAILEAADAVGMTPRQRLRMVELPLALPHAVGGIRTATVWTVGMATLATPVGARSLGELIFGGLQMRHYNDVLVGCIAAAVLAIALDFLLRAAESGATSRKRTVRDPALLALAVLVIGSVGITIASAMHPTRPLRVGAKPYTEQRILASIIAQSSHEPMEVVSSLGTTVAFDALASGEIDVYVEYTGTVWTVLMQRTEVPRDRTRVKNEVITWLSNEKGITVATAVGFENTYALVASTRTTARRISDLGAASSLVLATDYEFLSRPESTALNEVYGLRFRETRPMDPSLMYDALANGSVDVATGFSTDGRIATLKLVALDDDRGAIPPYDAIVLVRSSFAKGHPDVFDSLSKLHIDAKAMRALNAAVDRDGRSPEDVGREYLHR